MKKELYLELKNKAVEYYDKAHIILKEKEKESIEAADFGLNDVYNIGLLSVVYVNTERCCAKEMVLLPGQTCPEHLHPPVGNNYEGKEETFRCRKGIVYLYIDGNPDGKKDIKAQIPAGHEDYFTVFHEIVLQEGDQYTLHPMTRHWFQAGQEGAVISEFSTHCYDEHDIFTDPRINRIPKISE